jgi:hypothetical protein
MTGRRADGGPAARHLPHRLERADQRDRPLRVADEETMEQRALRRQRAALVDGRIERRLVALAVNARRGETPRRLEDLLIVEPGAARRGKFLVAPREVRAELEAGEIGELPGEFLLAHRRSDYPVGGAVRTGDGWSPVCQHRALDAAATADGSRTAVSRA